jgi:DNA-binding beta-propeller fold protein YncE
MGKRVTRATEAPPRASAQLNQRCGVAVDRAGNLYIADGDNRRIRKVTPEGIISTVAGNGRGATRATGVRRPARNSPLAAWQWTTPANVYLADRLRDAIRLLKPQGPVAAH